MLYPEVPTSSRPQFWTLRIEGEFWKRLCPDAFEAYASGRIDADEAQRRMLSQLHDRVAKALGRYPRVEVDDVAQELVVRIATGGLDAKFDPSYAAGVGGYLYAVVRNIAREVQRRTTRWASADASIIEDKPSPDRGPLGDATAADQIRLVRDRYLCLGRKHRDAVLVLYPFLEPDRKPERCRNEHVDRCRALARLRRATRKSSIQRLPPQR